MEVKHSQIPSILQVGYISELIVAECDCIQFFSSRHGGEFSKVILMQVEHNQIGQVYEAIVLHGAQSVLGNREVSE